MRTGAAILRAPLVALTLTLLACAARPPYGVTFPPQRVAHPKTLVAVEYRVQIGDYFAAREVRDSDADRRHYRTAWHVQELVDRKRTFVSECTAPQISFEQRRQLKERLPSYICFADASGPWLKLNEDCRSGQVGLGTMVLDMKLSDPWRPWQFTVRRGDKVVAAFDAAAGFMHHVWPSPELSADEQIAVAFASTALIRVTTRDAQAGLCFDSNAPANE